MKKRQLKKVFKIVSKKLNNGDFTKLKSVHFRIVNKAMGDYIDKKYITEFRPWWWDNFDRWGVLSLKTEHTAFFHKTLNEIEKWSGINMDLWKEYFHLNHK